MLLAALAGVNPGIDDADGRGGTMTRKHGRVLTAVAFALSAAGTVVLLAFLAVLGPFDHQAAPSLPWSIVLWGMVGLVAFVLVMRVVLFTLATLVGILAVGRRSALSAAHLLKVTIGF
jgi:hypothetical protein